MKKTLSTVKLTGLVSNQNAAVEVKTSHPDFPEIEQLTDTFKITVKSEETEDEAGNTIASKVLYTNDKEPFSYYKVPSLVSALRFYGAKLSDDAIKFIGEALAPKDKDGKDIGNKETGESVATVLEIINADLKASASRTQYSKVLNANTPITDEGKNNAYASQVRAYLRTNTGVSDENALAKFHEFGMIPKEFTIQKFRANKGKR